jgi:meiotically up-regulated gene 157 (Mug157) protein
MPTGMQRRGVLNGVLFYVFVAMSFSILLGIALLRLLAFSTVTVTPVVAAPPVQETIVEPNCPDYGVYASEPHAPFTEGRFKLPFQRPSVACRTFKSEDMEKKIENVKKLIKDPDLRRLFENTYPSTLDTAIRWHNKSNTTGEELTFIITGDIDAMWIRDSANQMQSYLPLLKQSDDLNSIASLYRGVINLQSKYLHASPFCNAFLPPWNTGLPIRMGHVAMENIMPSADPKYVWECKYELDSIASFLQVSYEYYNATGDAEFFGRYGWVKAVNSTLQAAISMMTPTYADNGSVLASPYSYTRQTNRATETLSNDGAGNPVSNTTGLVRSAFRPSDDATIHQFFIPANMMFSRYLNSTAPIMAKLNQTDLANQMSTLAANLHKSIQDHGTVMHNNFGKIYAYEVDGFGSSTIMDDANIPSLLSAPFLGYTTIDDPVYQNTRKLVLSRSNPYYMRGPKISAVGGPHVGPGMAWPMASIVQILTTEDDKEIVKALEEIVSTTGGLGLIHEGVNSFDPSKWTRQW